MSKPVLIGSAALSNGEIAVLAGYSVSGGTEFDDLQVAIVNPNTTSTVPLSTGNNLVFPSGDSPDGQAYGNAEITALPGGGMAILTWGDSSESYYVQILSNTGSVIASPGSIAAAGSDGADAAGAIAAWSGGVVAAYESHDSNNVEHDYFQRISNTGSNIGSAINFANGTLAPPTIDHPNTQWTGSMAVDSQGDVILGFSSSDTANHDHFVMYNSGNTLVASGTLASLSTAPAVSNPPTAGSSPGGPLFTALPGGGFIVVEYVPTNNNGFNIEIQEVTATGGVETLGTFIPKGNLSSASVGSDFDVPNIAITANGGTLVFLEGSSPYNYDTFTLATDTLVQNAITIDVPITDVPYLPMVSTPNDGIYQVDTNSADTGLQIGTVIAGVVTPPTMTAAGAVTFTGGRSMPLVLDSSVTVTDSSAAIATGTIEINSGYVSGDTLGFSNTSAATFGNIAIESNSNGTLILESAGDSASITQWDNALSAVTYSFTTGGDPTPSSVAGDTTRTVQWSVNDGNDNQSNTATTTIDMVHVAPTIAAGGTVTYNTGTAVAVLATQPTITDVDGGGSLISAAVTIAGGFVAGDTLVFANELGITGSYNAGTHVLTLTGNASIADYETALASIKYNSSASDPSDGGADPTRTIDWTVTDGSAVSATSGAASSTVAIPSPPTVTISLFDDTSHGSRDTSDDELQGTGAASTTVTFKENGSTIGSTTSDGNGNWTFTPSSLSQGSNTITASETNAGGTGTASITFTYDTTPPDVTISLVNDTSHGSLDTSDDELQGGGDANATVTFKENGTTIGTTTANGSGAWTFTPSSLGQGSNTITAYETDAAGNTGSAAIIFTYDTVAPDVTISLVNDTSQGSLDTSDDELQGSGDPNATVTFKENGTTIGTTTANGSGAWTFTPGSLGQGFNTVTAYETDAAGNTGSAQISFTYDTTPPDVTVQLVSGTNPTSNPDIEGTGDPNATVTIKESGTTLGTTAADNAGNWTFDPTGLSDGPNTLVAYETDLAGNTGSASVSFNLETAPTTATFDAHVYLDANGDGTQDSGETGLAGVTVNLLDGSGNPLGPTAVTDSNGNVSFSGLAPGSYEIGIVAPGDGVSQATDIGTPVTLTAGQTVTATEGVYVPAAFSVHVYGDTNADGSQDNGETGYQGVTVNLLNGSDAVVATTTTDASGNASFTGLAPGSYEVQVVTPSNDAVTQSTNTLTQTTLSSGGSASATVGLYAPPALTLATIDLTDPEGTSLGNLWSQLVANGVDPNPSSLTISAVNTSGTQGYVSYNQATQTLTYLATGLNPSEPVDSFTYTLKDGSGNTVTGTVDITITGPNLPTTVATTPNSTTTATGSGQRLISQGSGQTLVGSASGGDQLFGGTDTTINASGNGNTIYVEPGNHMINMGASDNTANVGNGANTISATGTGNTVTGGDGNDTISGMAGSTTITLGNGSNNIKINGAGNSITVGNGNNAITAGTGGNETVIAGDGNNTISAGGADDSITVGTGTNKITATGAGAQITVGNGTDTITASSTGDTITLGSGNDALAITVGGATIKAGIGTDAIHFAGSGNDVINQGGSDTLTDTGSNNTIVLAANGLDTITGNVLGNGDTFNLIAALAATNWDGLSSDIGDYLSMGTQGANATVQLSTTSGGAGVTIAVLNGAGPVGLSTFLSHALT